MTKLIESLESPTKCVESIENTLAKKKPVPIEIEKSNCKELDLNKLNDDELEAHKKVMDVGFFKNYKDPKSKDFVYEIEQDFDRTDKIEDSWDG